MRHTTTYLSPEECLQGEGLRCLHDPRFFMSPEPEPEPLPALLLAEIEMALALREHARRNTGKAEV